MMITTPTCVADSATEEEKLAAFEPILYQIVNYPAYSLKECIEGVLKNQELENMYLIVATRLFSYFVMKDQQALSLAASMYFAKCPSVLVKYLLKSK